MNCEALKNILSCDPAEEGPKVTQAPLYHSHSPSAAPKENSTTEKCNDDVEQDYDEASQRCPATNIQCVS